ncbi:hypothetical protein A2767_04330 [Candidatus Roizmanbacteria bacterium RIFCSPHIGHO2_01_FULL_35_10]|uniref:Type II secretion system protein GspH n=1 Tax=Candidatus Roizmanbacteria bacterium RIFCSPLOWO2_01_FULL_35_13 TaxID=1802055 RepID=A0A1F7I8G6_9BACT|nr:MAG: hypothetical protein A2767_04330 [Candidatus Roizmanbacteria bacterium RIFCSPHIGHO2_01_FULL_35_10]OGK39656.1 MAG: hypothetical protein A3A74_07775 [Candidatus Roizmanbacteria bacterium RIFCSPLOWO2_01_FULL_35_13]
MKKNAFTLVEILVICTILVLFSGTMLAGYNNFNQQKKLDKEVNQLVDVLNLAKSKARASDLNPADTGFDCSGSNEFGGYSVEINDSDYNFAPCCRDVVTKNPSGCGSVVQTYNFSSVITNISGSTTVNFYPLSEGASPLTVSIKNSAIDKCSDISISETGVISTSDIQLCY